MRRVAAVVCVLGLAVHAGACGRINREVRVVADRPASVNQLWQEPSNIQQRELLHGLEGSQLMPRDTAFTFVARDTSGWSPGFEVRQDATDWSVKLGPEAQSEVVSSRILWGDRLPPAADVLPRTLESDRHREWRPGRRESHPQQLGLEDLEQQDLRALRAGERCEPLVRGPRPRGVPGQANLPGHAEVVPPARIRAGNA
jgi:hypothetical protein